MPPDPIPPELRQKLLDLIDGTLPDEEFAALEKRLREDPILRAEYRESMETQAFLEWQHSRPDQEFRVLRLAKMVGLGEKDAEEARTTERPLAVALVNQKRDRRLHLVARLSWPIALTVLAGLVGAYWARSWSGSPATPTIWACVTGIADARWPTGSPAPEIGSRVGAGPIRLESGSVQLTFESGAVVALTGPAELELLAPDRVFLHSGRLTPYVPPAARGFTVLSDEGQFVDLGTEFDLQVAKDGGTQFHVIDGKVAVTPNPSGDLTAKAMTAGYAASMKQVSGSVRSLITQRPLLIDSFCAADTCRLDEDLARRQSGAGASIGYLDCHQAFKALDVAKKSPTGDPMDCLDWVGPASAEIRGGRLAIPIRSRSDWDAAMAGVILNHDFAELVGHRYTIAFKVKLPELGSLELEHWLAFTLNDQKAGRPPLWVPPAFHRSTNFRVCIHPHWQVGPAIKQKLYAAKPVFARSDAAGPYQVVVRVDETKPGDPVLDLDVNGVPVMSRKPVPLGKGRYLSFQAFTIPHNDIDAWGYVYDLCVSVDAEAVKAIERPAVGAVQDR